MCNVKNLAMAALVLAGAVPYPSFAEAPAYVSAAEFSDKYDANYAGESGKKWERDYGFGGSIRRIAS